MPRPELYPVKKVIGFDHAMLEAVEKWRAKQQPIPTVSDAIRQLVEMGLSVAASARPHSAKTRAKAAGMAAEAIDRHTDQSASTEEQASRKRRLLKGPKEFRDLRKDHK
jgi:hypothetical protein